MVVFAAAALCYLAWSVAGQPAPQVTVDQGTLKGSYLVSANGNTYAAYQGIPYAKPPVGKQRFKEPVPAKPWRGIWNAEAPGSPCLQIHLTGHMAGDEDCLYLNVYTPIGHGDRQLNVIVNIHGGAFMHGSAVDNGPKYLMDHDVVMVAMNYRLGPMGFFSTGDDIVPGNNGLKDQQLALRWVQKNIAAFGGNPDQVTLTGTSAGGASVHLHYISPLSKGLFHRGISLSGTALCPWTQVHDLKQRGEALGAYLGCPTQTSRELVDCLRRRPARAILQQLAKFRVWLGHPIVPFGPTIETAAPGAFITEQPVDAIIGGRTHNVPWITGFTTEEGLYPAAEFLTKPDLTQEFADRWTELAPILLMFDHTVPRNQHEAVAERIKQFYVGDEPFSQATSKQIVQMFGDRLFGADAKLTALLHAKHTTAPVYFYQFGYRGENSLSNLLSGTTTKMGASHGDDTGYVFEAFYCKTDGTTEDKAMSQLMVGMWTNYINTANPSPPGISWEPLQAGQKELRYLYLGSSTNVEIRNHSDLGNRNFWDTLPLREAPTMYAAGNKHAADEL